MEFKTAQNQDGFRADTVWYHTVSMDDWARKMVVEASPYYETDDEIEAHLERWEKRQVMLEYLKDVMFRHLTPHQQLYVILVHFAGLTISETGRFVGRHRSGIREALNKAYRTMREHAERDGVHALVHRHGWLF